MSNTFECFKPFEDNVEKMVMENYASRKEESITVKFIVDKVGLLDCPSVASKKRRAKEALITSVIEKRTFLPCSLAKRKTTFNILTKDSMPEILKEFIPTKEVRICEHSPLNLHRPSTPLHYNPLQFEQTHLDETPRDKA